MSHVKELLPEDLSCQLAYEEYIAALNKLHEVVTNMVEERQELANNMQSTIQLLTR